MIAALVASLTLAAAPPGFYEAKALEPAASYVAGKPARVYCAATILGWRDYAKANGTPDALALSPVAGDRSEFEPPICVALRSRLRHQPVAPYDLAASLRLFTHESLHQRGMADEGAAECQAMHEMPRVAVKFFGVKPGKQLRALMAQAWRSHRATPTEFQTVC